MSRAKQWIVLATGKKLRLSSVIHKSVILFFIIIFVSSCVQSQNTMSPTSTPNFDPMQSGYDLMDLGQPFSYLTNKMADKYYEGDIDFIEQNLPDLVKIARATDELSVSPSYEDAKSYLSKMMWNHISFNRSISENPSLEINSLLPLAQEGSAYYHLFVIEMNNLGHDLKSE